MPQSHPATGPVRFYHPYDFLPVRPSEAPVGILCLCCSRGHIRLRTPYGLTRLYTYYMVGSNDSQDSTGTPDTLRWESLVGVLHKGSKRGTLIFLFVVRLDKALNKQSISWVIWDTMTLTLPFLVITSNYKDKMGSPFILIIAFIYSEKIVFMLKVTLALTLHESCRHLMAFYHLIANAVRSPTQATATHWWLNIRLQ